VNRVVESDGWRSAGRAIPPGDRRRKRPVLDGVGAFIRSGLLVGWGLLLLGVGFSGCSEELPPAPEEKSTNSMVAVYQSPEEFEDNKIEINGERLDREWGSEFTPDRPYTHVRVSREHGAGDAGPPRYVSMKALYTDEHLYLLVQWPDDSADLLDDVFVFTGPSLGAPIVTCSQVGGQTVCDSTYRSGPQDSLMTRNWWRQVGDDDKFAIAFEMTPASGALGAFADVGCLAACHTAGRSFDNLERGRLDVWQWYAGRTNPLRNLFNPYDDPDDPEQGIPGYLDDQYMDPGAGLIPDEGVPGFQPNFLPGEGIPLYVYRRDDDPFHDSPNENCTNYFGEPCRTNNGVSTAFIWRNNLNARVTLFNRADIFNESVMPDARMWAPGDVVAGYLLTLPRDSRADVRGKAIFDDDVGVWTLEIARRLSTGYPLQDVSFDPDAGLEYRFTISIFDGATADHLGSEPVVLVFEPRGQRGQAK
jgi:hypothetical protein